MNYVSGLGDSKAPVEPGFNKRLFSRLYSILEPQNEDLVVNECVRSNSTKKEVSMDKKSSSLKLKLMKTPMTLMVVFTFAVSMFSFEFDYIHTRDSSRADWFASNHPA